MIRRKKQQPTQRSPHIARQQKQSSFQYSSNRSQSDRAHSRTEPEVAEKRSLKKAKLVQELTRLPYIVGAIIGLIIIVYLSSLSGKPHVVVRNGQTPVRDTGMYTKTAADLTNNIASRSKFTINREKIGDELQKSYPEILAAKVTTPLFGRSANIELQIAKPVLLLNSGADTYVLDSRGIAVLDITKERPAFKAADLPLITDQSSTQIQIGKPALTSEQVSFASEIRHQSTAKQLTVESMQLTTGGGELNVRYSNIPYFVKYNLNEDPRKSFGTFFSTKEYLDQKKTPIAEYIDVRIPERAYVK